MNSKIVLKLKTGEIESLPGMPREDLPYQAMGDTVGLKQSNQAELVEEVTQTIHGRVVDETAFSGDRETVHTKLPCCMHGFDWE